MSALPIPHTGKCRTCDAPAERTRCRACYNADSRARKAAWYEKHGRREYKPKGTPELVRKDAKPDRLDLLILAFWGDTPGDKIPPDVRADAEAGRMPRLRTESAKPKAQAKRPAFRWVDGERRSA